LESLPYSTVIIILYFFFLLNLVYYMALFILPSMDHRSSTISKITVTALSRITPVYSMFLAVPMYQVCYYTFFCLTKDSYYGNEGKSQCSDHGLSILNSLVALLTFLSGSLMLFLLGDMARDFNPFSKSPISSPKRTNILQSLVLKAIPPLIFQYSSPESRIVAKWLILICVVIDEVYSYYIP
jgi:hypothetical protein